jgi:replicative DNA helicase
MIETNILKYLCRRDNFDSFYEIAKKSLLTQDAIQFLELIRLYYEEHPTETEITCMDALAQDQLKFPGIKATVRSMQLGLATTTDSIDYDDIDSLVVEMLILRDTATQIHTIADEIMTGTNDSLDEVRMLLDAFDETTCSMDTEDMWVTESGSSLFDTTTVAEGLHWRLKVLNDSMGPLQKGALVVIGARPETGKTAMLASEATFMMPQLVDEQNVLWFCNEEMGRNVKQRVIATCLGIDTHTLAANYTMYEDDVDKLDETFHIAHKANMSTLDIEKACKARNPGLIVIDQLRKLDSPWGKLNELDRLQKLFEWARRMCQMYAPVLVVHQAGGTGEGMMYMDMTDLYGSKTVIQGEADAVIMIGKDPGTPSVRGINVVKNKLWGFDPAKRHCQEPVNFDMKTGRFS